MTNAAMMNGTAALNERGDMRHVVARLERLPYCSWHLKMRLIICTAWFFDAFDSIAIAVVLPPLIGMWHLVPQQIGPLIGIGFSIWLLSELAAVTWMVFLLWVAIGLVIYFAYGIRKSKLAGSA